MEEGGRTPEVLKQRSNIFLGTTHSDAEVLVANFIPDEILKAILQESWVKASGEVKQRRFLRLKESA